MPHREGGIGKLALGATERAAHDMTRKAEKRTLKETLERAEHEAVERAMAQTQNNVAKAADSLGVARPSLYRIMKRCGIASPNDTRVKD
jgi:two-component system NtrC family response regulator